MVRFGHIDFGFEITLRIDSQRLIQQLHGKTILELKTDDERQQWLQSPPEADALFTRESDLELYVFTADCVPLLFFSQNPDDPIAAVHSGWRSTLQGIATDAISLLNVPLNKLHVIIGPSILPCCFEVKSDLVDQFKEANKNIDPFLQVREEKTYFDLVNFIIENQLAAMDLNNIHLDELRCTKCSQPDLPSYRRTGKSDPAIRAWIRCSSTLGPKRKQ